MDLIIYGTILAIPVCAITYVLTLVITKDKTRADRNSSLAYRYVLGGCSASVLPLPASSSTPEPASRQFRSYSNSWVLTTAWPR